MASPQIISQTTTNRQELPEWYSSYLQNLMGRAITTADQGQIKIPLQQIAGLTPDQLAAFQKVRDIQDGASEYYSAGRAAYNTANDVDFQGAIAPGMQGIDFTGASMRGNEDIRQGIGYMGESGLRDTASAAYPNVGIGSNYLQQSAAGSSLASANPYIAASAQPTGLQAASPYLSMAAAPSYSGIASYMNPYNAGVTDEIARLGARNLSEYMLPQLSDDFVRAGHYGSDRHRDLVGRAVRDTGESVLGQQAQALQSGYGVSLGAAQADAARYAGLAGTAGGLGTAQQSALLGAGQATGSLSSADLARLQAAGVNIGQLGLGLSSAQATDAARALAAGQGIGNLGIQQGQLGLAAAEAQGRYGLGQGQLGLGAAEGAANRSINTGTALRDLGTTGQNQGLKMAGALETVGATQQQQGQANLGSMYNQQLQQYNLPWQTVSNLSSVIQGLPVNMSGTTQSQTTQPGPSTGQQIAGIGLGVAGLANSGLFRARGGAVKKPRAQHSYGRMPKRGISIAA